jgi:hypothetical protein
MLLACKLCALGVVETVDVVLLFVPLGVDGEAGL